MPAGACQIGGSHGVRATLGPPARQSPGRVASAPRTPKTDSASARLVCAPGRSRGGQWGRSGEPVC
jgi:hypothetical protein